MEAVGVTFVFLSGVAIGAVCGHYVSRSHFENEFPHDVKNNNPKENHDDSKWKALPTNQGRSINQMAAKRAFLENIDVFAPKLSTLLSDNYNQSEWTDEIIGINNPDLIQIWKKIYKNKESVLRLFSSWGLKPEMCSSFVCQPSNRELYQLTDHSMLEIGKKYIVTSMCWILTATNEKGENIKKVIIKGIVSKNGTD